MKPFNMKVCNKLLMSLKIAGIDPDVAVSFLGRQMEEMQLCPPNYGSHRDNSKVGLKFSFNSWVMRGFFPKTYVMFKIVMVKTGGQFGVTGEDFYANITMPSIKIGKGHSWHTHVSDKDIHKINDELASGILVGDVVNKYIILTQRIPKCMSPKGCKIHNLNLKG